MDCGARYPENEQRAREAALFDVGNELARPPSSAETLLYLLIRAEFLLCYMYIMCPCHEPISRIEDIIHPVMQALVTEGIFNHPDLNIQVVVASCIYQIVRVCIPKPDFPYAEDQMKKIFRLFVVAFKQLSYESGKHYERAVRMLESMAKLKSFLILLDLEIEIDLVVVEIFQVFLDTIRHNHSSDIFNHMKNIMIMIIEESDNISVDLLRTLLFSVKMDNKNTSPRSWELGKSVIENAASKLQPHIKEAVKEMNLNLADYAEIVASLCQGAPSRNDTVANEEVARVQVASEDVVNDQFKATDASCEEVLKLGERSEAGSETRIHAERSRRARKPNTLMRWEEGYQHAWLVQGSDDKVGECHVSGFTKEDKSAVEDKGSRKRKNKGDDVQSRAVDVENTKISKGSENATTTKNHEPQADADELAKSEQVNVEEKGSRKRKKTKSVVFQSNTIGTSKEIVSHTEADSVSKDDNDSNSPKQTSDNVAEKVVESLMSIPEKATQSKAEKEGFKKRKRTVKSGILLSGIDLSEKAKVSHSVSDPKGKCKNEITSLNSEPIDVVDEVVKLNVSEPTKSKQSEVKENKQSKTATSVVRQPKTIGSEKKKVVESPTTKSTKLKQFKVLEKGSCIQKKTLNILIAKKEKGIHSNADTEIENENETDKHGSSDAMEKMVESISNSMEAKNSGKLDPEKEQDPMEFCLEYGRELVNLRVMIWWPIDQTYYPGTVESYNPLTRRHKIIYDDGDEEILNMSEEKWELYKEIQPQQAQSTPKEAEPSPAEEPCKKQKRNTKVGPQLKKHTGSSSKM